MSADRELLQLAAKAAGVKLLPHTWDKGAPWGSHNGFILDGGGPSEWNPIENDGDALRLAVKLHLEIDHNHPLDNDAWVMAIENGKMVSVTEEVDGCREAATRRAIVRAAAAIGKSMP